MSMTIEPVNYTPAEHAAPPHLLISNQKAAFEKLREWRDEQARAAGAELALLPFTPRGVRHGNMERPIYDGRVEGQGRHVVKSEKPEPAPPRPAWSPTCETCSPIVAAACRRPCPDAGFVSDTLARWRSR